MNDTNHDRPSIFKDDVTTKKRARPKITAIIFPDVDDHFSVKWKGGLYVIRAAESPYPKTPSWFIPVIRHIGQIQRHLPEPFEGLPASDLDPGFDITGIPDFPHRFRGYWHTDIRRPRKPAAIRLFNLENDKEIPVSDHEDRKEFYGVLFPRNERGTPASVYKYKLGCHRDKIGGSTRTMDDWHKDILVSAASARKPSTNAGIEAFLADLLQIARSGEDGRAEAKRILGKYSAAMADENFLAFVERLYSDAPLFKRGRYTYPCAVYEAPPHQQGPENVDSILPGTLLESPRQEPITIPGYLELREEIHKNDPPEVFHNGVKYMISEVRPGESLIVQCYGGEYFDFIASGEAMKFELLWHWIESNGKIGTAGDPLAELKYRGRLHQRLEEPWRSFAMRTACLAVDTVVCFLTDEDYKCALFRRSRKKARLGGKSFQVVPSGMTEPNSLEEARPGERPLTYSVKENFLREYLEEFYSVDELEQLKREKGSHNNPLWYHDEPEVRELIALIDSGQASFHLTGFVTDLLSLNAGVCCLLLIRDPKWVTDVFAKMKLNWETDKDTLEPTHRRVLIPLADDQTLIDTYKEELPPTNMVISAAPTFWLGKDAALRILQKS